MYPSIGKKLKCRGQRYTASHFSAAWLGSKFGPRRLASARAQRTVYDAR